MPAKGLYSANLSLISDVMLMSNMKQGAKEGLGVQDKKKLPVRHVW